MHARGHTRLTYRLPIDYDELKTLVKVTIKLQ